MSKIIWTKTDEAPMLSSYSLLPIIKCFLNKADINIQVADISLSGRILAAFDIAKDDLKMLGELTSKSEANIIKLPNISASVPQLLAAILELQSQGFKVPNYDEDTKRIYQKVLGSAVNPVLRQGNSDRRSVSAVKEYAKKNPHFMGEWDDTNRSEVAYMKSGDFYANERCVTIDSKDTLTVEFIDNSDKKIVLKDNLNVEKGEIIDASFMSSKALDEFIKAQITDAKDKGLLFSVHLKASMMKVSDPVIFGHFVKSFFEPLFVEFDKEFKEVGVSENNGLKDLLIKIEKLPERIQEKIRTKIDEIYLSRPSLAMVNSAQGITNLHVPSDVIVDASMPAMIRNSGKMWDKNGEAKFTKAIIPDSTYAKIYEAVFEDFKANGTLDPRSIGSVSNVGLMAKKAEEYGSHDKTFIMENDGEVAVKNSKGEEIFKFKLFKGDIFRMTQVKDDAVKDWISLALKRAKITGQKAIFWLDENRAHDQNIIKKVKDILQNSDTSGIDIEILNPKDACLKTIQMIRDGKDTISVTGNVLRDYLTDLFPILELGTSSKMLSVVPLLSGGGLFETGAGGTAPMLVKNLFDKNYLAWDSLGEFLALIASLEHLSNLYDKPKAKELADTLNLAVARWLNDNRSPFENSSEIDTRQSHFYLALYWADELAKIDDKFKNLALNLKENETVIIDEFLSVKSSCADIKGYYRPSEDELTKLMRPSKTFNKIISEETI